MVRPYSEDLLILIFEAVEDDATKPEATVPFGVSTKASALLSVASW